jgi:hypothetical protein
MKSRIEELARECGVASIKITTETPVIYPTQESINKFANAILELAAKECENQEDEYQLPDQRFICAEAIRKLKV